MSKPHGLETNGFRLDLHVHTRAYSPCAEFFAPDDLGPAMRAAGLNGVLLTEHDQMRSAEELSSLETSLQGLRLYGGVEVTAADAHLVVVGLRGELPRDVRPAAELAPELAAQGAFVILAHPFHPRTLSLLEVAPQGIHGVEVASTKTRHHLVEEAALLARRWGLRPVAGSDAHAPDRVGVSHVWLPREPKDEDDLARMLHDGLAEPCIGEELYL